GGPRAPLPRTWLARPGDSRAAQDAGPMARRGGSPALCAPSGSGALWAPARACRAPV
ncbi:hypothetical protein NDU88_006348, partial [Pleurodeles waltl]